MKNKLKVMQGVFILAMFMTACGSGVSNTGLPPTKVVEITTAPQETLAPTVEPTATETPTPEPTVTEAQESTEASDVKDTYEYGVITEIGYASKWCNVRFTTQPGIDFGTQDNLEMYAQCADGARLEIYTELLPEEYLELSETDYLGMVIDELNNTMNFVEMGGIYTCRLGGDVYTTATVRLKDTDGLTKRKDYFVRRKESRMIIFTATCPMANGANATMTNILNCLGGYNSEPKYLPDGSFAQTAFSAGIFTENSYENEWLNLRIIASEGATLTKVDWAVLDTTYGEIEWESEKLPYIEYGIEFAKNRTADVYLTDLMDFFKAELTKEEYAEYVLTVDEQVKTELLGGQEYKVMTAILSRPERADRYEEYYCRVQDNYIVYFEFLYEDESREQIEEAKSLITEY